LIFQKKNIILSGFVFSIVAIPLSMCFGTSYSQEKTVNDTLFSIQPKTATDSSIIISKDTVKSSTGVDTVINYTSTDSIIYSIANRRMKLYGEGNIKYKQMDLKSERIDVNWESATMKATGVADTSDTTGRKFVGTPVMVDGGEEFHGHELSYNFKTQKGRITLADTKADAGFYYGSKVKKIEKDVMFISEGKYTTCDQPEPHFYFYSPRMKLMVKDKIVAEPIYFYIADVPVFALPFGVFPTKSGRRSGLFAPAYGEDATRGRFLKRLGYYWAMSDYYDLAVQGDWYTNGSYLVNSDFNYNVLYYFSGGISGTYKRFIAGEKGDPTYSIQEGYNLNIIHHQEINPTMRADVNFSFMSNNNYRLTNDLTEALVQSIFSNATLSKSWEGSPNSATVNISRSQELTSGRIDEVLPSLSFNRSQSFPFRRKNPVGELNWYELIGYNYGAGFTYTRAKIPLTVKGVRASADAAQFQDANTFRRDSRQLLNQNLGISISPKFGYFTVTPSFSFSDSRSQTKNIIPDRSTSDSMLIKTEQKDYYFSGFLSMGVSVNTRIYGILQPNVFGINAFRHTVMPNMSLTYSKQVYGKNMGKKNMIANFDVGNLFEIKMNPEGEGKEERKYQLLNMNAGVSYNFSADSLNISSIGVGYRTSIGNLLNIGGSSNFSLYKFDQAVNRIVNKYLLKEEGKLARLENFSISLSTSLSGEKKQSTETTPLDSTLKTQSGYYGMYQREEPDFRIPWDLSFGWNFFESYIPNSKYRSANINASLDFNLTEKWKFRIRGNYDIMRKEVSAPSIEIDRDLHCWLMNFSWVPIGTYKHWKLEIRIKAPQLQDIKITKQRTTY
jgi:lipopolysaccharide assembly outer membrane protein LptD (OstA)